MCRSVFPNHNNHRPSLYRPTVYVTSGYVIILIIDIVIMLTPRTITLALSASILVAANASGLYVTNINHCIGPWSKQSIWITWLGSGWLGSGRLAGQRPAGWAAAGWLGSGRLSSGQLAGQRLDGWAAAGWAAADWLGNGWLAGQQLAGWAAAGWLGSGWLAGWAAAGWLGSSWLAGQLAVHGMDVHHNNFIILHMDFLLQFFGQNYCFILSSTKWLPYLLQTDLPYYIQHITFSWSDIIYLQFTQDLITDTD